MMLKLKTQNAKRRVKTRNLRFLVLSFSFTLFALHFTLIGSFAQPISSGDLINNARYYDGKIVVYEGEVIGDIMVRGKYAWINVNDGRKAIGVWTDTQLAKDILYTGNYKTKGDWIEVTGVFHRACLQHGGDLDIHAQVIRKKSPGRQVEERLNISKRNLVIVLFGILCLVWIFTLLKRK